LGGSIFGGSAALPSELASLVKPQQDVSKLLLSTKTSIGGANQEYAKLMEPGALVPSPPVYAARLNGLLKTLASAEGAVEQCVKARKSLVDELQKILDTNKTSLAVDEEQLSTFKRRKVEVDDKKREVEFAIMQGLSSEDVAPSNGIADQAMPEPDRPEMEALTPEPEDAPAMATQQDVPEFSPDVPQEATFQPSVAPGIEMLSELAAHYKSVPSAANGAKKRRLDSGDDFPDLGEDDGIDADVSEMLRRESNGA
jgi:regulator of Ty1 transposition protein 103